jgi:hypothetical protein
MFGGKGKGKLKSFVQKVAGKIQGFKEKHPVLAGAVDLAKSKLPGGNLGKGIKIFGKLKDKLGKGKIAEFIQKHKEGRLDAKELDVMVREAQGDDYDPSDTDEVMSEIGNEVENENKSGMFGGGKKGSFKKWWNDQTKTMKVVYIVGGVVIVLIILGFTVFKGKGKKKFFGKLRK